MSNSSIAVSGNGVMGQLVRQALTRDSAFTCAGCVGPGDYPVLRALPELPDGIIDFSHPDCLSGIIEYVTSSSDFGHMIPVVIATTGYSEAQIQQIHELSRIVPVVFSSNFSPGVTILTRLLKEFSPLMADWDVEIVETHHRRKLDAPSGTALTLAKTISAATASDADGRPLLFGRHGHQKHEQEIGVHAVRGGDVRGIHEIFFFGPGETLTIKHEALDRGLFAAGAVKAMKFALEQKVPGLFSMEDVLFTPI